VSDLLLATTNPGKQRELGRLLRGIPGRLVLPQQLGLELDVPEPHATYAENAAAKASAFARASGLPALADDSGLEVAALDWGPGVHTARYGGAEVADRAGLIVELLGEATDRRARMVCWLALAVPGIAPDGTPRTPSIELFHGVVEGAVATERRGAGGFGYDPIFLLPSGVTTAELPDEEKDAISHRGRAVAAAMPRLRELLATPGPIASGAAGAGTMERPEELA
jgi:XTP/dITP diphosphohydrolase